MNQQKIYYQKRAKEYERVYQKTERQEDLKTLHTFLQEQATDKNILEIACGTGYWTKTLATTSLKYKLLITIRQFWKLPKQNPTERLPFFFSN